MLRSLVYFPDTVYWNLNNLLFPCLLVVFIGRFSCRDEMFLNCHPFMAVDSIYYDFSAPTSSLSPLVWQIATNAAH